MMLITRNEPCPTCKGEGDECCANTGTLDGALQVSSLGHELAKGETTEGIVIAALDEALSFAAQIPGPAAERVAYLCAEALDRLGVEEAVVAAALEAVTSPAPAHFWSQERMRGGRA